MLRGDQQTLPTTSAGLTSLGNHPAVASIEKNLRWNLLFFGGAVVTFGSGLIAVIYWVLKFTWAPCTFMSEVFLLFLGLLMIVLDFPIPHPHPALIQVRDNAYKFVLFMTRFTGRGMWYLFLATLVFCALYDNPISPFLGVVCSLYLGLLGIAALAKGVMVSLRLESVRSRIKSSGRHADHFFPKGASSMSKEMFKRLVEEEIGRNDQFTNDELDYVINALAFSPYHDGMITLDEFEYWLRDSSVPLVV